MFSRIRKTLLKKIEFRIAAWYSAVFILWSVLLCVIISFLLFSTVRSKERGQILDKYENYLSEFNESGMSHLIKELERERELSVKQGLLIFIIGPTGEYLYTVLPEGWQRYNPELILQEIRKKPGNWMTFRGKGWLEGESEADSSDRLEIKHFSFDDGSQLYIGQSDQDIEELISDFLETYILILIPIFIAGVMGGLFLSWRTLSPLKELVAAVKRVETGDMDARVPSRGTGDDLDELANLFNKMLERIEILIRGMKESLDNVAHDLKTPLTRMRASIERTAQSDNNKEDLTETLLDCAEESERLVNMLDTLMDISEAETGTMKLHMETLYLPGLLEDICDLYTYPAEEKNIQMVLSVHAPIKVLADRNRLYQVIANLVDNAVKYTPLNGSVSISARHHADYVEISIEDTGPGIANADIKKIFQRLYRADKSRSQKGLGLGLALVDAVIKAHKGEITVANLPQNGTVFKVRLPII